MNNNYMFPSLFFKNGAPLKESGKADIAHAVKVGPLHTWGWGWGHSSVRGLHVLSAVRSDLELLP